MNSSTLTRTISIEPSLETDPPGTVRAIVAVFGNVDRMGDRIMPGAFDNWLAARRASGKAVPVLYSHDWQGVGSLLGYCNPEDIQPVAKGLYVRFQLDLSTPWAKVVHTLLGQGALEYSFGYRVIRERKAADGANELLELEVSEFGPCLKGVNPATETISVKGSLQERADRLASGAAIHERVMAEERIKQICAEEGITDPVVEQAKAHDAAEERRQQHEIASAKQLQTALAMQAGHLDEVKIGPNGNVIAGPIRRAQIDAEETREKATRQAEREQRERDQARAEASAEATRKAGPGVGGLRGKRS
jgi:HK97 family phage prohead protease